LKTLLQERRGQFIVTPVARAEHQKSDAAPADVGIDEQGGVIAGGGHHFAVTKGAGGNQEVGFFEVRVLGKVGKGI